MSKDMPAKEFGWEPWDSRDAAEGGREMGILRHSRYALKVRREQDRPSFFLVCASLVKAAADFRQQWVFTCLTVQL